MSGILVGIGVITNISIDNKYIGAMLFSLALLSIIECNLFLYTGKIGFINKFKELSTLINILFFNLFGIALVTTSMSICNKQFYNSIVEISQLKFNQTILQLFVYGLFCGVLMFIAVYCKNKLITIFCIMTFILSGFEHCVADFSYLIVNFNLNNLIKFIFIILGNSFGSITANKLITDK